VNQVNYLYWILAVPDRQGSLLCQIAKITLHQGLTKLWKHDQAIRCGTGLVELDAEKGLVDKDCLKTLESGFVRT
jgi:hypothetical protein